MRRWIFLGCALLAVGALAASCRDGDDGPDGQGGYGAGAGAVGGSLPGGSAPGGGGSGAIGPGGAGPEAVLVSVGDPNRILLQGLVLTPDEAFDGEVLVEDDRLTCVAASCSGEPGAASASVVQTNGIIMPGMIDTHNHILFNIFDETDWSPEIAYQNHHQWTNEDRYGALVDAKQYLNGQGSSPINLNCELDKYGELKALVAGTTAIVTAATPANKICYRTLARTIDQSANGICGTEPPQSCDDHVQANTLFPSTASADAVCANFDDGDTESYLIHCGEGVDQNSLDELYDLYTVTTVDGCLWDPRTIVVHGTAFGSEEFDNMAAHGMGLVWSPASNVFLYGSGTDLSKTADIPLALSKGLLIALAPDWSMGGSPNLLDELKFADRVDAEQWGDQLTPQMLVQMVTSQAAALLALSDQIGRLQVGMKADVTVLGGDLADPYLAVVHAEARDVRLVLVDGKVLYGDDQLEELGPAQPGCEPLDICGRAKFLCAARADGTASDKFGQSFAEIQGALTAELEAYDALDLSEWDFAPLTPLVRCP